MRGCSEAGLLRFTAIRSNRFLTGVGAGGVLAALEGQA
jgi:hypothetical protein